MGDTKIVQVVKIDGSKAIGQPYHYRQHDALKPGYSLEVSVDERPSDDLAIVKTDKWRSLKEIHLIGGAPARTLQITVDTFAPLDEKATADTRHYQWPEEGEEFTVQLKQGRPFATHPYHGYEIQVSDEPPITSRATVEAKYENHEQVGEITSYEEEVPGEGDVVQATIDASSRADIAWYDDESRIQLADGISVSGDVSVEITQDSYPLQGQITDFHWESPTIGDTVRAYVHRTDGETFANPIDFEGQIKLPDGADSTGFAKVEITALKRPVEGRIVDYEGLPEQGDSVQARVERGKSPNVATTIGGEFDIRLEEDVLATGEVRVKITDDSKPRRGTIESYRGLLPEIGEIIPAKVEQSISFALAKPENGTYIVYLQDAEEYEGMARVEITEVDDRIEGKIVSTVDSGQEVDLRGQDNPFQDTGDSPNITRKKH